MRLRSLPGAAAGWILLVAPLASARLQSAPVVPFAEGERLVYDVMWAGFRAGTAILEIKERIVLGKREVFHLTSTAQSNDFISIFYPVDDRIDSYFDAEGLYSHRIIVRQREGKRRRDKEVLFDQANRQAILQKNGKPPRIFEIPQGVQDPLSSLYFFRTKNDLRVGKTVVVDVHESGKNFQVEMRIVAREEIETPAGKFGALKVQGLLRYEGLFLDKGDVTVWFSDDARHIPVMMKSKIKIGTIVAVLTSRQDGFPKGPRRPEPARSGGLTPAFPPSKVQSLRKSPLPPHEVFAAATPPLPVGVNFHFNFRPFADLACRFGGPSTALRSADLHPLSRRPPSRDGSF